MAFDRVATFETLINRAAILLQRAEADHDLSGLEEALRLLDFLQTRMDRPFSPEEITRLLQGNLQERQSSRSLLDQVRARQKPAIRTILPAPIPLHHHGMLTAAE